VLEFRQSFLLLDLLQKEISMSENIYKAMIQYAGDEFFIGTTPSGHAQAIDTKGDRKSAPTPMEMLLVSVAACTAADVISILKKKRQVVTDYRVEISAERREEHPRAFTKFHVHHIVCGRDVSGKSVAQAVKLSDTKYCSVAATVRPTAEITTSFEIVES
jgi:putative redox protein